MTTAFTFIRAARVISFKKLNGQVISDEERMAFVASYGIRPEVCVVLLRKLRTVNCHPGVVPLLWALGFLKTYQTETILSGHFGTDRKTFRESVWPIVEAIGDLQATVVSSFVINACLLFPSNQYFLQIVWENRHRGRSTKTCKVTVDGTDCPIQEPIPFSKKWYSHKFKKAGLRYEVAVNIKTGDIVWINGPFPCGSWNDIKIFRCNLKLLIPPGEMVEADKGW